MKSVVLGIGNTIVRDDGVGIYVSRILKNSFRNSDIAFNETYLSGFIYVDLLEGYDTVFIIDSIRLDNEPIGEVFKLEEESDNLIPESIHNFSIRSALTLGKKVDLKMPSKVIIYAINVGDNENFGESLTSGIQKTLPLISKCIKKDIEKYL